MALKYFRFTIASNIWNIASSKNQLGMSQMKYFFKAKRTSYRRSMCSRLVPTILSMWIALPHAVRGIGQKLAFSPEPSSCCCCPLPSPSAPHIWRGGSCFSRRGWRRRVYGGCGVAYMTWGWKMMVHDANVLLHTAARTTPAAAKQVSGVQRAKAAAEGDRMETLCRAPRARRRARH